MEPYEKICDAFYQAVDEVNATWPDLALKRSPSVILVGPDAALDSTSFVELIIALEQKLQAAFGEEVPVMDLVEEIKADRWTAHDLMQRIGARLGCLAAR